MHLRNASLILRAALSAILASAVPVQLAVATDEPRVRFVGPAPEATPAEQIGAHPTTVPGELIVTFAKGAGRAQRARVHEGAGGTVTGRGTGAAAGLERVRVGSGVAAASAIARYRAQPGVVAVQPNYVYRVAAAPAPNDPGYSRQWGLENSGAYGGRADADIDVLRAWEKSTGGGVVVAVTDTGVDLDHPELAGRLWTNPGEIADNGVDDDANGFIDDVHGYDFHARDADPSDTDGHGTHVAGVIAAETGNALGVAGVAPGARIMALRSLSTTGGDTLNSANAIAYAAKMGADIVNASWGSSERDRALENVIKSSGLLVVAAAGNDGVDSVVTPFYPASLSAANVVSVGATDRSDGRPTFSNFSKTAVDLAAPGDVVYSTSMARRTLALEEFGDLSAWDTTMYGFKPWALSSAKSVSPPRSLAFTGYSNNENAAAFFDTPLDLRGGSYRVGMQVWLDLDSRDTVSLYGSSDGVNYYGIAAMRGSYRRWLTFDVALSQPQLVGKDNVRLMLMFDSDGGGASPTYAGVYVDDLRVYSRVHSADHTNAYETMSGTSMAAPYVSGAAALALAAKPSMSVAQLKGVLLSSTEPVAAWSGRSVTGGRLNAHDAVALARGERIAADVVRLAGADRYDVAVAMARAAAPGGWAGVDHVILASGEDRAAADPLAASGLSWAYGSAPLMLVRSSVVPSSVKLALREIAAANPKVVVHLVGGTASVPSAREAEIRSAMGAYASRVSFDRVAGADRYSTAATIAARMRTVRPGGADVALVANGAEATRFYDALALAPISAATGAPVLLVSSGAVPTATMRELAARRPALTVVGGGPATVSSAVVSRLGATRWSGSDRYATATSIASNAVARGWLSPRRSAVAAKLPDALAGGVLVGSAGGPLLLTEGTRLTNVTARWLAARANETSAAWVLGGSVSVSEPVKSSVRAALRYK